ncbi:hypothetical protein [uncultured Lamprocystis sp.]|uniref:hypothetical protein n=1 Tax=uncultured Lamprocystis sp. TaxID=543132 RepID=UPI0025F49D33|nr:hypothetical protein [uncultured Lamprocystis sp.]
MDSADEFTLRTDADLSAALESAASEIDRWRPAGLLSAAATAVLRDVSMTLARMLIHQDQALDVAHPIVREALEARAWLRALAAGTVRLPDDATTDAATATTTTRTGSPTRVYGDCFVAQYDLTRGGC